MCLFVASHHKSTYSLEMKMLDKMRCERSVIKRPTDSTTGTTSRQPDAASGQTSTMSGKTSNTSG